MNGLVNQDVIEAGFDQVRASRFLAAHLTEARDPDFWRSLNPDLTISERPCPAHAERLPIDPDVISRATRQIVDEGYVQTPPVVPAARVAALRRAALRIVDAGFPSGFTCVYDEFFQAFQGLDVLFAPLLGERYRMILDGLWTFCVPAGNAAYGDLTAAAPHRDSLGPDPRVIARQTPAIMNVWIPLTDVTPIDSCIYAVPAPGDPDYYSAERGAKPERFRLQDIRALPVAAGSVLSWSTHLLHWGSRSSRFADGPRLAIAAYFQRGDAAAHPASFEFGAALPFDSRIALLAASLGFPALVERQA